MIKCNICGKEFNNGKQLGGHVSASHNKLRIKHLKENMEAKKELETKTFIKRCPKCGEDFEISRRIKKGVFTEDRNERKFCSRKCANGRIHSEETKNKIGQAKKIDYPKKFCKDCEKELGHKNKSGYCKECYLNHRIISDETKKKLSEVQLKLVKEGKHHGWPSRNTLSYPEKFFVKVLKNNGYKEDVDYKLNFPVTKKSLGIKSSACYFLDFYFENKKIDLEVDGSQHFYYEKRVDSDNNRDQLLIENDYKVYRIKWKNINTEGGKLYIKNEIDKFLDYLNSF